MATILRAIAGSSLAIIISELAERVRHRSLGTDVVKLRLRFPIGGIALVHNWRSGSLASLPAGSEGSLCTLSSCLRTWGRRRWLGFRLRLLRLRLTHRVKGLCRILLVFGVLLRSWWHTCGKSRGPSLRTSSRGCSRLAWRVTTRRWRKVLRCLGPGIAFATRCSGIPACRSAS